MNKCTANLTKKSSKLYPYFSKLNNMDFIGDRIKYARKLTGLSQQELANKIGVSKSAVSQWENGQTTNLKMHNLHALEDITGVRSRWISDNQLPIMVDGRVPSGIKFNKSDEQHSNYIMERKNGVQSSMRVESRRVPAITWEQVIEWSKDMDQPPPVSDKYYDSLNPCSERSFIFAIQDDSMATAHGTSFPAGTFVCVDPALSDSPKSGEPVLAKIHKSDDVVFRFYVQEGSNRYLKPSNQGYKIVDDPFTVLGVYISTVTPSPWR